MDNALRPRDIQARIRSGRSVDEVAAAAGMSAAMVERFAAPVLAEREYVAAQAMTAPVRRRGDTSGHRKLRVAISDRLRAQRVDIDQVTWDSARMEDGRWAVVARYVFGDQPREAVFHYDPRGRFCVPGNTEARWLLGEPVDPADDEPTVDLGDRDDSMALVRSVTRPVRRAPHLPAEEPTGTAATSDQQVRAAIQPDQEVDVASQTPQTVADADSEPNPVVVAVTRPDSETAETTASGADGAAEGDAADGDAADGDDDEPGGLDVLYDILDRAGTEYTEDSVEIPTQAADAQPRTDRVTPDAAAIGPGGAAEPGGPGPRRPVAQTGADRVRQPERPVALEQPELLEAPEPGAAVVSDAAAVPDTGATEYGPAASAAPVEYPVEPSLFDEEPDVAPLPPEPAGRRRRARTNDTVPPAPVAGVQPPAVRDETGADQHPVTAVAEPPAGTAAPVDEPASADVGGQDRTAAEPSVGPSVGQEQAPGTEEPPVPVADLRDDPAAEPDAPAQVAPVEGARKKPRKRASVPSWDDIMFGSPRSKG